MKLYYHPVSTVSRPVVLFAADSGIRARLPGRRPDDRRAHEAEPYGAINPSRLVPVLEDGDFRLTESSAILKYLADKIDSPAYPKDLRRRARVNEMMDWLNTGFYRDFGYGLVYPQIFPHQKRRSDEAHAGDGRMGQGEGEVLARRARPASAGLGPEVPVRRRHHDRRLSRRRDDLAGRGRPLRLLALSRTSRAGSTR